MSLQSKLREAELNEDHRITLTYETGADVIHAFDDYVEDVLQHTDFTDRVAEVITFTGFKNEAIKELRNGFEDFLADYPRDGSGFESYVSEVLADNIYDFNFIERTVEQYDFTRGFLTLEASVETTVGEIMAAPEQLFSGWSTRVSTKIGELKIDG